jgi:glycosyltransferase involved in cell wall biosynthesis
MPRLLIDATPVSVNAKGVGRYAYHLCLQLAERLPEGWSLQILILPASQTLFPSNFRAKLIPIRRTTEIVSGFLLPARAKRLDAQLLLKTSEGAGYARGLPTVTVCHDVDRLIAAAQGISRGIVRSTLDSYKTRLRRQALKHSEFVICNSQFTRQAVETHYGISYSRTAVGYCAVDPRFYEFSVQTNRDAVRRRYGVSNFILTFATGDPRENFRSYPAVAASMAALGVNAALLIAGIERGSGYVSKLRAEFAHFGLIEGKHFILEDFLGADRFQDLAELYTAADFYLELSLHEGFGMQLVEAMACGTTCISSHCGALAEIGGKYVLVVDPAKPEEIAAMVKSAYDGKRHLQDNREEVHYTRGFSWDAVGRTVAETLLRVADSRLGVPESRGRGRNEG